MKKQLFTAILASALLAAACSKPDPEPEPEVHDYTVGAYVLNNGNWGSNDANLALYDLTLGTIHEDYFAAVNGKKLGDIGQDIIIYGTKAYIAVSNSGVIFVVDKTTCKEVASITKISSDAPLSPRNMVACSGRVYVSYYEGYLGEIDTATLSVTRIVKVGDNPEGVAASGGKVYVANSGGMNYPNYGNTVSVVDITTMQVTEEIEVGYNPMKAASDSEGDVYISCSGNYADDPGGIYRISSGKAAKIDGIQNPNAMTIGQNNQLYILTTSYDENWNAVYNILVYDANGDSEQFKGKFAADTKPENPYSLSADITTGRVYVGCSDYIHTGSVSVYNADGSFLNSFSTGGLNPQKVVFITEKR